MTPDHAAPSSAPVQLLIGTRKGAWTLSSDPTRAKWSLEGPHFLGNIVNHFVRDPRDGDVMLVAARTGHLGPTIFRSADRGKSWKEATNPPAFTTQNSPTEGKTRSLHHTLWLAPGHADEPGVWYAGTSPQGLFRSEDKGATWASVAGFNDHPNWPAWTQDGEDQTPDGAMLHSILIDPRDRNHMYVGCSGGGIFETTDCGADWRPLNQGVEAIFIPEENPEFGHDPHCVQLHPLAPDILYHQNHCGIYRLERPETRWTRIGDNMPREVGDVGFPMTLHPRDTQTVWVFPMDATEVWPRVSPDGKPAVYRTSDSGKSWQRLDRGLPPEQGWFTVLRQSMAADRRDPVGVYFGTTTGELWGSTDEGESWQCLVSHLPHILSVEAVELS